MAQYGYIKVDNISLSAEIFNKVCKRLTLITSHCHQSDNSFYIYGIENNATHFNVDRSAYTQQSKCFLDAVKFYTRNFGEEIKNGFIYSYIERVGE